PFSSPNSSRARWGYRLCTGDKMKKVLTGLRGLRRVFLAATVLAVAGFTALAAGPAKQLPLPSGWRVPSSAEAAQKWRKRDPNRYLVVRADFNGDGVRDQARLLRRDKGEGLGLFAFVSQKDGTFKTYLLHEDKDKGAIEAMGIKTVSP